MIIWIIRNGHRTGGVYKPLHILLGEGIEGKYTDRTEQFWEKIAITGSEAQAA